MTTDEHIDLPPPLVPPECDLRGTPYMAMNLIQTFESDLYALSTGDEFKAAFSLWGRSFSQIPAGSLPNDERLLEHLSGSKRWKTVRQMALRGWFQCSDGRLYHRTVADAVLRAWNARISSRLRTEAARAARKSNRTVSHETHNATEFVTASVTDDVKEAVTGSKQSKAKVNYPSDSSSVAPSAPPAPCAKIGRRLPDDWVATEEDRKFAISCGLDPNIVEPRFKDYWSAAAGANARKLDWAAAWRNWCRNERPPAAASPGRTGSHLEKSAEIARNNKTRMRELQCEMLGEHDDFQGTTIDLEDFNA